MTADRPTVTGPVPAPESTHTPGPVFRDRGVIIHTLIARIAEAEWLIRTDHKLGRHDTYGAGFTCKGCAWLRDGQ